MKLWCLGPVALIVLSTACASNTDNAAPADSGPLGVGFHSAAQEQMVPVGLLYAVATVEQGLDIPLRRQLPVEVEVPQAGPLALRHGGYDSLAEAATLSGRSEHALREDALLALRAGAQLFARKLQRDGVLLSGDAPRTVEQWTALRDSLASWSGLYGEHLQREYARQVLAAWARGGRHQTLSGETLQYDPAEVPPALLIPEPKPLAPQGLPEFPGAEVFPLNPNKPGKYAKGRDGYEVDTLLIHDTEGGWNGSVATIQNSESTSAHYIIGLDGRLGQFMSEADTGYHAGNRIYNRRSIGIEHVGYWTQPFPEALYVRSAELVSALAAKYGVHLDREHIIGHDQVPSSTKPNQIAADAPPCMESPTRCQNILYYGGASRHTDPGVWEWGTFMKRLGAMPKCNDLTTHMACDTTKKFAMGCVDAAAAVWECANGCTGSGANLVCEIVPDPIEEPEEPEEPGSSSGGGQSSSSGSAQPSDPGTAPGGPTTPAGSSSGGRKPPPELLAGAEADIEGEGGCQTTAQGRAGGAVSLLLGVAALLVRRRRAG